MKKSELRQIIKEEVRKIYLKEFSYRPINKIAQEIEDDWNNIHPNARPYLNAMHKLTSITDNYGVNSGASIITNFLGNSKSWKGTISKKIKRELNTTLKKHYSD